MARRADLLRYRDGIAVAGPLSVAGVPRWNSSGQRLGARLTGGEGWLGDLLRFAVYNRALTQGAVTAHYVAG